MDEERLGAVENKYFFQFFLLSGLILLGLSVRNGFESLACTSLHILNGYLVYRFLRQLISDDRPWAILTALVFLVHPALTESYGPQGELPFALAVTMSLVILQIGRGLRVKTVLSVVSLAAYTLVHIYFLTPNPGSVDWILPSAKGLTFYLAQTVWPREFGAIRDLRFYSADWITWISGALLIVDLSVMWFRKALRSWAPLVTILVVGFVVPALLFRNPGLNLRDRAIYIPVVGVSFQICLALEPLYRMRSRWALLFAVVYIGDFVWDTIKILIRGVY